MRMIDADAFVREISVLHTMTDDYGIKTGCEFCMRLVEDAPTIKPERKTGRWVGNPECDEFMTCSACGCEFDWVSEGGYPSNEWGYCPECGAFMGGEHDG